MRAVLERGVRSVAPAEDDADADAVSDAALLTAVAGGDRDAFGVLYRRHAPWLLLRLSRRCADPGLVDEVLQDTFLAVWRGARNYSGGGEVAAWIWGVAVRRLVDAFRRRPTPAAQLPPEAAGVEPSAEDRALSSGRYGSVAVAVGRLPVELRAVVQATLLDGLTTTEAARLLGIPAGTVKTRMMRARAALREELS